MGVVALRTMYMATMRTIMQYGAGAWWVGQVGVANGFDKVLQENREALSNGTRGSGEVGSRMCVHGDKTRLP